MRMRSYLIVEALQVFYMYIYKLRVASIDLDRKILFDK